MHPADHELARLAARRHGILRRDHFTSLGVSGASLTRMVQGGRAFRVHRGVYSLGHPPTSAEARRVAAVDAAGTDAALSGLAGAHHLRLQDAEPSVIEVLVPRRHRPVPGIRVRTTRSLPSEDVMVVRGIRVLRVERLLVELADEHDEGRLCRWLDEARHRKLLNRRRLARVMRRHRTRPGQARLVRAVAMLDDGSAGFRSRWEQDVIERIDSPPGVERHVCRRTRIGSRWCEPDLYFPTLALVVQVDGPDHDRPNRRRDDRRLDHDLEDADVTTLRIHWRAEADGIRRANAEVRRRLKRGT